MELGKDINFSIDCDSREGTLLIRELRIMTFEVDSEDEVEDLWDDIVEHGKEYYKTYKMKHIGMQVDVYISTGYNVLCGIRWEGQQMIPSDFATEMTADVYGSLKASLARDVRNRGTERWKT